MEVMEAANHWINFVNQRDDALDDKNDELWELFNNSADNILKNIPPDKMADFNLAVKEIRAKSDE